MKNVAFTINSNGLFNRSDGLRAALSVIPSMFMIISGNVLGGMAFAIGTIPTSQLGIAPTRKQRILFSIFGSLFGLGILLGSYIAQINSIWLVAIVFFGLSLMSSVVAAKRPVGIILLALVLPALSVGFGFDTTTALSLFVAFVLGSLWSGFVTLFWPETPADKNADGMKAFVAKNPPQYGILLGLAAATAILYGYFISPEYIGWTATATLLIMRPIMDMVKSRGLWRALSTVIGGVFAVIVIQLQLPLYITAALVLIIMVIIIGTNKSGWWLTPAGTAFFILTISLLGVTNSETIKAAGWERITDNIVGAAIALFYGLLLPSIIKHQPSRRPKY